MNRTLFADRPTQDVKAKRRNISVMPFGYPKRYPKSHFRNIDFRYPKNLQFLTLKQIEQRALISER